MDIRNIISVLNIRVDLIIILLSLMALDIFVGVIKAFYEKNFQSKILREGLIKKLFEIIIICIGYLIDYILEIHNVGIAVLVMLIGAEMYSIVIENASKFIPIPKMLRNMIDNLRSEKEEEVDNGERL